jgi:hypothetical protein
VLRARFAPWYYVIAADSFAQIRPQRRDLVTRKGAGGQVSGSASSR